MKLVIFWIRQLVFGVWCLKLHGVSASTSQSILGKCQHLVIEAQSWTGRGLLSNEASWQWAASIPLQVSALTAKVLSNPVTQGFAHILSIFFPSPGTRREIRPLRQVQRPIPKWLIFENIGSFHSPWYLIESCLCKAPSRFAWWSQHSAAPQTAEQREQEAVRALCPRTRHLVTGLCLWLALFGGHVAPHLPELLWARLITSAGETQERVPELKSAWQWACCLEESRGQPIALCLWTPTHAPGLTPIRNLYFLAPALNVELSRVVICIFYC